MTTRYIPTDIVGLKYAEQVSWSAGDPGSGYTNLPARNIKFEPTANMVNAEYLKPEACRGPDESIFAGKGGVLTFEIPLRGGAGSESELSILISNCGLSRNARAGGSGKIKGTPTTTTIDALTSDIGSYVVGDAICVGGSSTDTQVRFVLRVQDDTPSAGDTRLTVSPNFSDTPTSGDSYYNIDSFTPTVGEPEKYMTWHLYQGQGATDRLKWVLEGCAGTFKILSSNADSLPFVEFTYQVDTWTASESSTTTTSDSFNPGHPLLSDPFYVGNTATYIESVAFDPGIKLSPITATSGTQGRQGWLYHGVEPKIEFSAYHDIDFINTIWTADLTAGYTFQSVKDTDEFWGIWIPAGQIVKPNFTALGNEHLGVSPDILAVDPGYNADSTNYPLFCIAVSGSGS